MLAHLTFEFTLGVCLLAFEFTLGVCLLACLPGAGGRGWLKISVALK